jgi:hypothetical protein
MHVSVNLCHRNMLHSTLCDTHILLLSCTTSWYLRCERDRRETPSETKVLPSVWKYFDTYCKKWPCLPGIRQENFLNHCLRNWRSPYNCARSQTHAIQVFSWKFKIVRGGEERGLSYIWVNTVILPAGNACFPFRNRCHFDGWSPIVIK